MAAQVSHAAFAANEPDGMCASGPSVRSAKTCSTMAWTRAALGLQELERGVGEDGMVPPEREQLVLAPAACCSGRGPGARPVSRSPPAPSSR